LNIASTSSDADFTPRSKPTASTVLRDDHEFLLRPWAVNDEAKPLLITGGQGVRCWDADGRTYLDFSSQLTNLNVGHQHPRVVEAIQRQAGRLCTVGPQHANEPASTLGRLLAEVTPGRLKRSFLTPGGSEANEAAIKTARAYTGRDKIITRYMSYHGGTYGALSVSGESRRLNNEPGIPGVVRMFDPYTYRCPVGCTGDGPCGVCGGEQHLEQILTYEGAENVAAVMMETVTGGNGYIYPPDGYLQSIRRLCDHHGILLIFDEVLVGFGRTGAWFACDHWDVEPDILTVAKGMNSGYVPLGAMVVSEEIGAFLAQRFISFGHTYSMHPLACASAVATIELMRDEGIVEHVAEMGAYLEPRLRKLADAHPSVGDVRGRGLLWGLELVRNRETREPLSPYNERGPAAAPFEGVQAAIRERGVLPHGRWNALGIAPPLIIEREELDEGLAVYDEALGIADEYYDGSAATG
jgi:taurine---2-oxoglutarate transaminase